jgi:hypothetical protein
MEFLQNPPHGVALRLARSRFPMHLSLPRSDIIQYAAVRHSRQPYWDHPRARAPDRGCNVSADWSHRHAIVTSCGSPACLTRQARAHCFEPLV